MRALVIGPTGVNIEDAISSLQSCFMQQKKYPEDDADLREKTFNISILEDEIKAKVVFHTYLDSDDYKYQEDEWVNAFGRIILGVNKTNPQNAFLCMNYPYFRDDRFFPAIDVDYLKQFSPDIIITLIDDAYAAWKRILAREEKFPTRSIFKLRDMFTWRSASILLGDIFAKWLQIDNYVIPVKHPPIMLYRLIFESKNIPRIYASYPITYTRKKSDRRKEVDNFREQMHKDFCVFDPLSIDDRVLIDAHEKYKDQENVVIEKSDRWQLPPDFSMVNDEDVWGDDRKIIIPRAQVDEVVVPAVAGEKSLVDKHILYRDFRAIAYSDLLVAYRPYFDKHFSRGVAAEIQYANQTARKPCEFFWSEKDGSIDESPFSGKGNIYYNLADIIKTINSNKPKYIKRK